MKTLIRDDTEHGKEYVLKSEALAEIDLLTAERDALRAAINAMLTHMGMDEDEWNKPTFDQARAALAGGVQ